MRPGVFGVIILAPLIWLSLLAGGGFLIGWFWPATAENLYNNMALNLCGNLGILAILLSPLSKESRSDFRHDFDKAYSRFYIEDLQVGTEQLEEWFRETPTEQRKYVEAAITVASNLYLQTIPGGDEAAPLQFSLPDSRYRYMIFCLSAVVAAALAYDEEKQIQPEAFINGCLHFVTLTVSEETLGGYFDGSQVSIDSGTAYLQDFLKYWSRWPELEEAGKLVEKKEMISYMIHTTESNVPADKADMQRLDNLAFAIDHQLPMMRSAFIDLTNR